MSDSEGDFSDELLELAGAGEKKRKKSSSRSLAKRRKAAERTDSEEEYESEDDGLNPYPLEGKFIDEADRERLLQLPEIERENILSQRLDEIQRFQDKRNLDQMLREQRGEIDGVARAAKRPHQVRGATEKKSKKLDELKAKRKAKTEKKRVSSPKQRERSASPTDMEMSSEDEEDGQISKEQQDEEREARLLSKNETQQDKEITLDDLQTCGLSRDALKQYAYMPWFEEYVKGAYVRYLTRNDEQRQPVYRVCEVVGIGEPSPKPYKIDSESFDTRLELRYGPSTGLFTMDRVSNQQFTEIEFQRLKLISEQDKCKLPSLHAIQKKVEQFTELPKHTLTEAEVTTMVERKTRLAGDRSSITKAALDRAELVRRRDLAQRRRDFNESAQLDAQIAELDTLDGSYYAEKEKEDVLTKINERNRQANREAVRRAEAAEAERKRRAWLARAAANSRPGTPGIQRPDTPAGGSPSGTPKTPKTPKDGSASLGVPITNGGEKRSVSPSPSPLRGGKGKGPLGKRTFESIVANSVEIDLGDF